MKFLATLLSLLLLITGPLSATGTGPVRVLFLGHPEGFHPGHNSHENYPKLAKATGRDGIYFDYVTSVEEAFGDAAYLNRFDAVLIYANHAEISEHQWANLKAFVEGGKGLVPVHCASWCFGNQPEYDQMVGARFAHHKARIFRPRTIEKAHGAIRGVPEFEAWDETYVHNNHNPEGRTVLQVREVAEGDNITEPEPWTWVREQGKGRVFYTASGHDEKVWDQPGFHELLKKGILWAVGEERRRSYEQFIDERTPLRYEKRDFIPNYENRAQPLQYQLPLSPEDSLHYTQVPVGFRLQMFAAEPDIVNPICLAWDEKGRLWVAETIDYPNDVRDGSGNDRIKILEDTDGDGRCDKVTVFAEGLNIPTSLTFWDGGIIVAQAPDFLYLKDEDGDDQADLKKVLFTGWGIRDTHAGPSNLRFGIDNWIYGAVGYSRFIGDVGGERHNFGNGIFRFRPDASEMEFLYQFNNNTWGLSFNAAGDVFGSTANNNPAFFGGFPRTGYPKGSPGISANPIASSSRFYPITPNIRQVDVFDGYTAAAGYTVATSDNFPKPWRDKAAFVGGPTGNLLGRFEQVREGSGYLAKNRHNVVASADEWFSPVAAEIGPDGNLWIADWYNFIIQHNPAPTADRGGFDAKMGKGNAHENPNRDLQHGRIYRLIWDGATESDLVNLEEASTEEQIQALGDSNQFWRLAAQRKLVAAGDQSIAPILRELVKKAGIHGVHALWVLEGLGELDRATHQFALLSGDPVLKRNAIRALPHSDAGMQLFFDTAVVQAKDSLVRLAAFSKLAHFPDKERVKLAAQQLIKVEANFADEWLATALKACGAGSVKRGDGKPIGHNLLRNASFEKLENELPQAWFKSQYQGKADIAIDATIARTGSHSLMIFSDEGGDAALSTRVPVKPNTDYQLSGWVRTDRMKGARGAQLNAHEVQGQSGGSRTSAVSGNVKEWKKVSGVFNSLDRKNLTINCLFGGWGRSTGTAWWDDVELREIEYEIIEEKEEINLTGDVEAGKKLFHEHAIAACIRCHMIDGKGGPVGPALDGIASRKSRDYIYESLVNPQSAIADGFAAEVSPMPPMGVILKPGELRDLMAYLETLK